MGSRFNSEFVYVFDQNNLPYFVQSYYGANMDDRYQSDIYLANKSYCVTDLFLTDEVETKGEFLPRVKEKEWRAFLQEGPSANLSTILAEAGLADISVSKLVFIYVESSSRLVLNYGGFVSSAEGVRDFDPDLLGQAFAFAGTKTGSIAEQEQIAVEWMIEQVQNSGSRR